MSPRPSTTYLLVDGENIDATLGIHVLGHRPQPDERPRWDRIRDFAASVWGQPVKALFFLNASNGQMPMSFVQALLAMDFRPIPLAGSTTEKVVDIGIQRTLDAIAAAGGDVLLASHDADFASHLGRLAREGRRIGVLGLREYVSADLVALARTASRCSTSRTTSARSPPRCLASGSSPWPSSTPTRYL